MSQTQTLGPEHQLHLEAEILRHLWYEVQATPVALSGALRQPLPILHECLEDLIRRRCVYQFWPSPDDPDASVYCLTRRAHRHIQQALQTYTRYKLRSYWDALRREQTLLSLQP